MDYSSAVVVFVVAVVIVVSRMVKIVPQGYQWTVERFGRYTHTIGPGFNIIIPFADAIGRRLNVMETVIPIQSQEIISRDNAMVRVDAILFFQVIDTARAAYEINYLEHALANLAMTNIRTVLGSMDLDQMLSQRDSINSQLSHVIDGATAPWGVKVTRIEIREIAPPQDLVESMARQMKAERDKRAQILEAQGFRESEILKAEGAKQSQILYAEGERMSAFLASEARERQAEAEAKAITGVSQAIASGNPEAMHYFIAERYLETLKSFATSDNPRLMVLPMELSGVASALSGAMELLKNQKKEA